MQTKMNMFLACMRERTSERESKGERERERERERENEISGWFIDEWNGAFYRLTIRPFITSY